MSRLRAAGTRRPGVASMSGPGQSGSGSARHWLGAIRTATGGMLRHKVQAAVIGMVLLISTASATLGFALLAASNAPFQHAFSSQHGAHATVTVNPAHASPAELAATRTLGGVTAAPGPFAAATVPVQFGGQPFGQLTLAGRSSPGGPVDDVVMNAGHWPDGPGQVVLDGTAAPGGDQGPGQGGPQLGSTLTVSGPRATGAAGGRKAAPATLTVVGFANSITNTADGWVTGGEVTQLQALGAPASAQMMYSGRPWPDAWPGWSRATCWRPRCCTIRPAPTAWAASRSRGGPRSPRRS